MKRKEGPNAESSKDLHIGVHTGKGKVGSNKPALKRDRPLLVVRVRRELTSRTANKKLHSSHGFTSYHRTPIEITEEFDAFYISGYKSTTALAKKIEPILQSFAELLDPNQR